MEFVPTRHQVPRSARADIELQNRLVIIKYVSELHATYQIRMLAHTALQRGKKLEIHLPKGSRMHSCLKRLIEENRPRIRIVRVQTA